jgi:alpha-tubulin suppressor-like RCC1 family protein
MGLNKYGELGDGTTVTHTSAVQSAISGVAQVRTGSYHTLVLKTDRTVWGFGANGYQLGDGTTVDKSTPVRAGGSLARIISIAAGVRHSLALKSDGTVWAWGLNSGGQLGLISNAAQVLGAVQFSEQIVVLNRARNRGRHIQRETGVYFVRVLTHILEGEA